MQAIVHTITHIGILGYIPPHPNNLILLRYINLQIDHLSYSMTQNGKEMAPWRSMLGRPGIQDALDQGYPKTFYHLFQ